MAALLAAASLVPVPAHAEKADRNKPIHLEADRVTVDDAKQISIFSGNVVLTQGSMILRGDKMEVRQDKDGFRRGTVWGNLAYFRQKREGYDDLIEGWSERIEYDSRADKVEMFNRAMLKRAQDEVRGNYISYDAGSEFFQVVGGGTQPGSERPGDGRVRAIMQPKPKDIPSASQGVPLKSDAGPGAKGADAGARK